MFIFLLGDFKNLNHRNQYYFFLMPPAGNHKLTSTNAVQTVKPIIIKKHLQHSRQDNVRQFLSVKTLKTQTTVALLICEMFRYVICKMFLNKTPM